MTLLDDLRDAVVEGRPKDAVATAGRGLEEGIPAGTLLKDGLIAAMTEVGRLYEEGEYYVPEMLVAAHSMKGALAVLRPELVSEGVPSAGTVAIGTVRGDLHDIGKSLVSMMLEGAGFQVVDLGIDTQPEQFVQAIRDGADVAAMSALLTTTMVNMKESIDAIDEAGLRDRARIIVGGAPITAEYAQAIGADGYAPDASSAVRLVHDLIAV